MTDILIVTTDIEARHRWARALDGEGRVCQVAEVAELYTAISTRDYALIVLDVSLISASVGDAIQRIREGSKAKILLLGKNWDEQKQIEAIVSGALGYCEKNLDDAMCRKAAESVISGEIWVPRHLIPKVITSLTHPASENSFAAMDNAPLEGKLGQLSARELEVARMIGRGDSNKVIASRLFISERTVKAHLGSIFKKLGVQDRLHLAVLLKDLEQ